MSFRRTANAIISKTAIHFDEWMDELRQQHEGAVAKDHVGRIAKDVLRKCDPKQFLLSHATIVASVDTYAPKGSVTGKRMERGVQIDVRYPDFRVKPSCQEMINNNNDSWERSLLLSTYRTFIGAPNYLEHIQIPELSKGFIVDAIARDLGDTCYVDILVATDRKHQILVRDIMAGNISALSMGCFMAGTMVTLSDGSLISIEDVRPDMVVLSQKGNACRVDNLQIRQNRWSMRRVKASGVSPVLVTDNHKFYAVPRGEPVYRPRKGCGRLSRKTVLVPNSYSFEYREAGDLLPGDIVGTPIPSAFSAPSVSESDARLLGLWVGDGWKFDNKHDSTVGVGFCLDAMDEELSREVELSLDQVSWRSGEMCATANGGPVLKTSHRQTRRNANYIMSTSRTFRSMVDSHISGRRALTKVIGHDVMAWPRSHQLAFLSGIVDTDGCVSTTKKGTKQVFISTRNENLANQYSVMLARCGILSTVSKVFRRGTKMLPNASGFDFQVRIRNDGAVTIPSQKIRRNLDGIRYTPGNSDRWISGGYVYSRIKSVDTFEYAGLVYDLQVDVDHSYVANGVGVSNCISLFTCCNRCGNVASDDTQLCPCIMYDGKGSKFADESGVEHRLGELIGHVSVPNSNTFIEASWVRNPAFKGAVRRNFLNGDMESSVAFSNAMSLSNSVMLRRSMEPLPSGLPHAASSRLAESQDQSQGADEPAFGKPDDAPGGQGPDDDGKPEDAAPAPDPAPPSQDRTQDLIDKAQELLLEGIVKGLGDKLAPKPSDVPTATPSLSDADMNETLLASRGPAPVAAVCAAFRGNDALIRFYASARRAVVANRISGLTPRDLIVFSWINDTVRSAAMPASLYQAAMSTGPSSDFPSERSYVAACGVRVGRALSAPEQKFFARIGRIASAPLNV